MQDASVQTSTYSGEACARTRKSSKIKYKFNNVEILHKFMKTISKKLLRNCAEIPICNSILEDVDVVSLWRDRIWDIITFDNCLIKITKKMF